jgi:hypothetical protein
MVMIANYQLRLDILRPRHPEKIRMGSRIDPGRSRCSLFRDLLVPVEDGSSTNTVRVSSFSSAAFLRDRMGDQREATAQRLYPLGMIIAHCRRRLRHLRRQCAESGFPTRRSCRRHHRGGFGAGSALTGRRSRP